MEKTSQLLYLFNRDAQEYEHCKGAQSMQPLTERRWFYLLVHFLLSVLSMWPPYAEIA